MDDVSLGELNRLLEAFFVHLRRRGKAARTVKRWRSELHRFASWVGERPLHEIGAADLELGFLGEWEANFEDRNGRPPSLNSTRAAMQALRSFYGFYVEERRDVLGVEPNCRMLGVAVSSH